jgi:hypothetical protein
MKRGSFFSCDRAELQVVYEMWLVRTHSLDVTYLWISHCISQHSAANRVNKQSSGQDKSDLKKAHLNCCSPSSWLKPILDRPMSMSTRPLSVLTFISRSLMARSFFSFSLCSCLARSPSGDA